jgi:hypothetical protein
MFKLVLVISLFLTSAVATANSASANKSMATQYKSYKEWKDSQLAFWHFRGQAEMAKDLTMADYFAGYITKQDDQTEAIKQVSSRLSAAEVAELMTIYANSVFGTQSPHLPYRAENLGKTPEK